ncbi:MAG: hypothetical protein CVV24_06105 [Ignavibacteriae bacterium HGW-Ignavibacteriae-3]|nr:MAG: hypothetical protein CVV24_06105 [Ignavibacteriae bacterium HGW-Ignavibacteriae-3]
MEITNLGLLYKDPPVTKAELVRAQQSVAPVNFPSYEAIISDKAKELALKLAEKQVHGETKAPEVSK